MFNLKRTVVVVLNFGMIGICSLYAQIDRRLDGTWGMLLGGIEMEYTFNNGNYEFSTFMELLGETTMVRGTYTTSDGTITLRPTHIHGAGFGLESRWLTQSEARTGFLRLGLSVAEFNQNFGVIFAESVWTYTIRGNTISFSQPMLFTRR